MLIRGGGGEEEMMRGHGGASRGRGARAQRTLAGVKGQTILQIYNSFFKKFSKSNIKHT